MLTLYAHPFSSYSQKVLTALYENGLAFEWKLLESPDCPAWRELAGIASDQTDVNVSLTITVLTPLTKGLPSGGPDPVWAPCSWRAGGS